MAANFPITEGQLAEYLRDKGFVTNLTIESCLNELSYIKKMDMQQWVTGNLKNEFDERAAASAEDTRQKIVQVVSEENAKFTELREGMQKLLDSTQSMSAVFSDQVATATSEVGRKHDATLAALQARDAQLRAYVDEMQAGNAQTFELLSARLASVGDGKQAELEHKVNELVESLRTELNRSGRELYDKAMSEARSNFGARSQ